MAQSLLKMPGVHKEMAQTPGLMSRQDSATGWSGG
jgi:hypothetical protein